MPSGSLLTRRQIEIEIKTTLFSRSISCFFSFFLSCDGFQTNKHVKNSCLALTVECFTKFCWNAFWPVYTHIYIYIDLKVLFWTIYIIKYYKHSVNKHLKKKKKTLKHQLGNIHISKHYQLTIKNVFLTSVNIMTCIYIKKQQKYWSICKHFLCVCMCVCVCFVFFLFFYFRLLSFMSTANVTLPAWLWNFSWIAHQFDIPPAKHLPRRVYNGVFWL